MNGGGATVGVAQMLDRLLATVLWSVNCFVHRFVFILGGFSFSVLPCILQFEKEVKNSFISELIKVQAKRRQFAVDKKRGAAAPVSLKAKTPDREAKYLTTVIPYDPASHLTTRHMQIMMKILAAINEDSPTTPALLTGECGQFHSAPFTCWEE